MTAPDPQIGGGIEVKLSSAAIIREHIVLDTKGPGVMVFGARNAANGSLVERNVTIVNNAARAGALFVLLARLGGLGGRLAPRQHDVVEIHARRAGEVDLVDLLEAENAQGPPRQLRVISCR